MPVIRYVPQDPTDLVIAGERMRAAAMLRGMHAAPVHWAMTPVLEGGVEESALNNPNLIAGAQLFTPMMQAGVLPPRPFSDPMNGTMIRSNACVCTPTGAIYCIPLGLHLMDPFYESTVLWVLAGVTRDKDGVALGNCRVRVFETGRMTLDLVESEVGEVDSDGSGNYSIAVPMNTLYQVTAYLVGSPDLAGISVNTLVPTANG